MASAPRRVGWPHRGEIWVVAFDPAIGSEIRKTRPALVIQNDVGNRWSSTTIVAAITSRTDGTRYPTEVEVRAPEGGLERDSLVLLDQIRTVDRRRLVRRLGRLKPTTQASVNEAVLVSLGFARP